MNDSLVITLMVAGVAFGTPIALAAVGELVSERSGILNIGIEGTMLIGAISAFWATSTTGSLWVGVTVGAGAGALVGLLFSSAAVALRVDQIVLGFGLFLVGLGLSSYLGDAASLSGTRAPARVRPLITAGPADWPVIGPVLLGQNAIVYLSWLLVGVASFYLYRTRTGLAVRAVGDDPAAADSMGVRVQWTRVIHVIIGSAGAGLAGSYYSVAVMTTWTGNPTQGAGWIALALVILGGWRPWRVLFAAYLFGVTTRLGFTLQVHEVGISAGFLNMLPYALAFIVLVALSIMYRRDSAVPRSLARPYSREGS